MNKFLQVLSIVCIVSVAVLSFVGCGNKQKTYSEEEYQNLLMNAVSCIPEENYTMTSENEFFDQLIETNYNEVQVYNTKENKLYSKNDYTRKSKIDNSIINECDELWLLENNGIFVEYTKLASNASGTDEIDYSAIQVSDDHIRLYNGDIWDENVFESNNGFEKFKEIILSNVMYKMPSNVEPKIESKFSTNDKLHKFVLTLTANYNDYYNKETKVDFEFNISFNDERWLDAEQKSQITVENEVVSRDNHVSKLEYSFDETQFASFPQNEFENVEIIDDYTVENKLIINDKIVMKGNNNFDANLLYELNKKFIVEYVGVNFEYYYDKEYTLKVGSTDKVKSYKQNIYIKATPQEGYALVIIYGDNNSILCTNTGAVALNTADYQYTYNGEVIDGDVFNVEGNQTYYIEATYI